MFINRHLLAFVRQHRPLLRKAVFLQLLLTLSGTLIALGIALAVRMILGTGEILVFSALWQVFFVIALCIALRFVLAKRKAVAAEECSLAIKASLRQRLLEQLFSLGPAFLGQERTGNLTATVSTKVEFLNEYYTTYLPTAVAALVNAAVLILVLACFNGLTALTAFIGYLGMVFCPMLFYFLMRERGEKEMRAHVQYYSDCLDSLQGMPTLKAFNANRRQKDIIHAKGESLRQAVMGQLRITMLENVVLQFFIGVGSTLSVAVAAYQCAGGSMASGYLVYALFLIGACFAPMVMLINSWHLGYRGVVASYSISSLLEEKRPLSFTALTEKASAKSLSFQGDVRFEQVYFAYDEGDEDVLQDVSFCIPHGTTTALVGASGSGKSTMAHLLAGFYPVREGAIFVGDERLDAASVSRVQDQIAAVWQDCRLFYGTVEENIRVGKPDASLAEIKQAARDASIDEFITELPDGYKTMIGESGLRFSGGERQRMALARAFLRNAPIVILDEATSSLDRRNEIAIQRSLQRLSQGKTVLIIAHRLATIQAADQIILMDHGRVAGKGTHEQLLLTSAAYRRLMGHQLTKGGMLYEPI